MDTTAASFVYENSTSFNIADSSSIVTHDRKEYEICLTNSFQTYKPLPVP